MGLEDYYRGYACYFISEKKIHVYTFFSLANENN